MYQIFVENRIMFIIFLFKIIYCGFPCFLGFSLGDMEINGQLQISFYIKTVFLLPWTKFSVKNPSSDLIYYFF